MKIIISFWSGKKHIEYSACWILGTNFFPLMMPFEKLYVIVLKPGWEIVEYLRLKSRIVLCKYLNSNSLILICAVLFLDHYIFIRWGEVYNPQVYDSAAKSIRVPSALRCTHQLSLFTHFLMHIWPFPLACVHGAPIGKRTNYIGTKCVYFKKYSRNASSGTSKKYLRSLYMIRAYYLAQFPPTKLSNPASPTRKNYSAPGEIWVKFASLQIRVKVVRAIFDRNHFRIQEYRIW